MPKRNTILYTKAPSLATAKNHLRISVDLGHTNSNENVKKNLSGGGAFLLTLSIIAGVCLFTLPSKNDTANAADNDNIQYQTIYLKGNSDPEQSKVIYQGVSTGNYHYVLMDDWTTNGGTILGENIIFDFNGHKISDPNLKFTFNFASMKQLELTNSATSIGNGYDSNHIGLYGSASQTLKMVISGNLYVNYIETGSVTNLDLVVRGGAYVRFDFWNNQLANCTKIVAPYMSVTQTTKNVIIQPVAAAFAVSTQRDQVDARSEITVGELWNLVLPTGTIYYLYGRNTNGSYQILPIRYRNGFWYEEQNTNNITWLVVNLDGTDEQNRARIAAVVADEPYVKYVLQNNWSLTAACSLKGQVVIFDLHGYTYKSVTSGIALSVQSAKIFEITDSSAEGTGVMQAYGYGNGTVNLGGRCVIISGGSIRGMLSTNSPFIMTGGSMRSWYNGAANDFEFFYRGEPANLFLPSYVETDHQFYYRTGTNTTGASFAIYGSTNDYVSGAYNYEFGTLIENLGPGDCLLEKLTNPYQPNYLLYRESPTAAYQVIATL